MTVPGESEPADSVYACDGCGAWHRQLFLLTHTEDCPDPAWHVTTRRKAEAEHSGRDDHGVKSPDPET